MEIIKLLILTPIGIYLAQELYWRGGRGKDYVKKKGIKNLKWSYRSIVRDAGCSIVFAVYCSVMLDFDPLALCMIALSMAALWASISTYFKKINKIFGRQPERLDFLNFSFVGMFYGLACLPLAFAGVSRLCIFGRAILLAVVVGGLGIMHQKSGNEKLVQTSERLIGAVLIGTMPILFIGGMI